MQTNNYDVSDLDFINTQIINLKKLQHQLELRKIKTDLKLSEDVEVSDEDQDPSLNSTSKLNNWTLLRPGDVIAYFNYRSHRDPVIAFLRIKQVKVLCSFNSQSDSEASDSDDRHSTRDPVELTNEQILELAESDIADTEECSYSFILQHSDMDTSFPMDPYKSINCTRRVALAYMNESPLNVYDRKKYQDKMDFRIPEIYKLSEATIEKYRIVDRIG